MTNDIKLRLTALGPDQFEDLCIELLPLADASYARIEPNKAKTGKTRKGTPDAYVLLPNGHYVAFQFTTQQDRVEQKVMSDLQKLNGDDCRLKGKIVKAVVCVNTHVSGEIETYRQFCERMGWEFDLFSLQRIAQLLLNQPLLSSKYLHLKSAVPEVNAAPTQPDVTLFDCGHRLAEVRNELGLQPSEFTELVGFRSEKQYLHIEQRLEESPSDLIARVAEETGVSPEWLKHGRKPRYPVTELLAELPESAIGKLRDMRPRSLYVTLDLEKFLLCGAAQVGPYAWRPLDFRVSINFWTWVDCHQNIKGIFQTLQSLSTTFGHTLSGRIISLEDQRKLQQGTAHPRTILPSGGDKYHLWVTNIVDINRKYRTDPEYKAYYGDWFLEIQRYFREYY